jgi:hypothetical protein
MKMMNKDTIIGSDEFTKWVLDFVKRHRRFGIPIVILLFAGPVYSIAAIEGVLFNKDLEVPLVYGYGNYILYFGILFVALLHSQFFYRMFPHMLNKLFHERVISEKSKFFVLQEKYFGKYKKKKTHRYIFCLSLCICVSMYFFMEFSRDIATWVQPPGVSFISVTGFYNFIVYVGVVYLGVQAIVKTFSCIRFVYELVHCIKFDVKTCHQDSRGGMAIVGKVFSRYYVSLFILAFTLFVGIEMHNQIRGIEYGNYTNIIFSAVYIVLASFFVVSPLVYFRQAMVDSKKRKIKKIYKQIEHQRSFALGKERLCNTDFVDLSYLFDLYRMEKEQPEMPIDFSNIVKIIFTMAIPTISLAVSAVQAIYG